AALGRRATGNIAFRHHPLAKEVGIGRAPLPEGTESLGPRVLGQQLGREQAVLRGGTTGFHQVVERHQAVVAQEAQGRHSSLPASSCRGGAKTSSAAGSISTTTGVRSFSSPSTFTGSGRRVRTSTCRARRTSATGLRRSQPKRSAGRAASIDRRPAGFR